MPNCLLCSSQMRYLFAAKDYARPEDQKVRTLHWCDACEFGRLEGAFTPQEIASFYPSDYYTHANNPSCSETELWTTRS